MEVQTCLAAVVVLGKLEGAALEAHVPKILALLKDDDSDVCHAAVATLGKLKTQ